MEELTMSTYSSGLLNQLGDALEKDGWTVDDVDKLRQFKNLPGIKAVIKGQAVISYPKHLVDMKAQPFIPHGLSVAEHIEGSNSFELDMSKISLYLSKKQENGYIEGNKLRKELKGQPVMNANLLDYLLEHQDLIPEDWKNKTVFFWGTIYRRSSDGNLCVRYLYWNGSKWRWNYYWLGSYLFSDNPALLAI